MPARVLPPSDPGANWYEDDPALHALLARYLPSDLVETSRARLNVLGRVAASRLDHLARLADRHPPRPHRRTPDGARWDHVEFHPSYHELQALAREHRVFTLSWIEGAPRALGFTLGYLYAQAECGYYCPACMTDGAAFVLGRHAPAEVRERYLPRLVVAATGEGWEGAMYLTEKGGGSEVGAGTRTSAVPQADGTWRVTGEKWFASNCVADVRRGTSRATGRSASGRWRRRSPSADWRSPTLAAETGAGPGARCRGALPRRGGLVPVVSPVLLAPRLAVRG